LTLEPQEPGQDRPSTVTLTSYFSSSSIADAGDTSAATAAIAIRYLILPPKKPFTLLYELSVARLP
jgi:hypothetical protein